MSSWKYLSYQLNDQAFGYGNGKRFNLEKLTDICCGATSNSTGFSMPTHYGTHIDFPFHFLETGKKSSAYAIEDFIYKNASLIEVDEELINDYLIRPRHLSVDDIDPNTDLLMIKTGFCNKRLTDEYWEFGLGFARETAEHLKSKLPNLKTIAFDLISLNSYQNRVEGRAAHKEFLGKQDVLIIEEMDFREVSKSTIFNTVIVAPLRIENCDGAPVTVMAEINE